MFVISTFSKSANVNVVFSVFCFFKDTRSYSATKIQFIKFIFIISYLY